MGKKILGILFIVGACLLTLSTVFLLPKAILNIINLIKVSQTSFEYGFIVGQIIYWFFHIAIMIVLWIFGLRWVKNPKP